ncbi:c-type cytochrome [Roseovarius sp. MBR-51]
MLTTLCRALPLIAVCLGSPVVADDLGRALFNGQPGAVADAGTERRLRLLPCKSCHGRDGGGGDEGRAPAITGSDLGQATALRPAYDADLFAAALRDGTAPSGRSLNRLMPRFDLTDAEAAALFDYLDVLENEQRRGRDAAEIRLGLSTAVDRAFGSGWRRQFQDQLAAALGARVYGRQVSIVSISASATDNPDVFAVLLAPTDTLPHWADRGIPVLFPLGQLEGDEDAALVRSFLPTKQDVERAIAMRMAETAAGPVAVWPQNDDAMTAALARAGLDSVPPSGKVPDLLVTDGEIATALTQTEPERIWSVASRLGPGTQLPRLVPMVLALDMPGLLTRDAKADPRAEYARLSALILAAVLKEAGRDITRAGLIDAFENAWLGDHALDYRKVPLSGTSAIEFLELAGQ